ncbi:ATP-binding protein [Sphingomonas sp. MMS24-J13]|uniref:ATP-binding protein n=1 Tax=Sphingomonas sp. MMS24-J13 TaxID=3238686 RepID=UPI0038511C41
MASARSLEDIVDILRQTAREVVGADGIAVVVRDGDTCFYAAEDAILPLWQGARFPMATCVSGWAMLHRETAIVPDIAQDERIPYELYRETFVRSLIMTPIGAPAPIAALGAYWAENRDHDAVTIAKVEALARSAAVAIENARLIESLRESEGRLRELAATFEARVVERTQDLMKAQEVLRQSQKLEAMGQLTGGVAHDFNNLLVPILGGLDMLARRGTGDAREQRLISGALQSAERARALVQRLLAFARRQPLTPTAIDLAAIMLELSPLIGSTIGPRIELSLDIAEGLPLARGEQNQVEMALINLVVNARDAMPDGGRLRLEAHHEVVSGAHRAGLIPGEYVRIGVVDTGIGMNAKTVERAIEPFFSTKGVGQGTGLGLSMVHGLALQLGGSLLIDSSEGIGTAIHVWLPATAELLIATPIVREAATPRSGIALVVDDEPLVRASTADMLIELGFVVHEASSGAEALTMLATRGPIDLLVTDHLMPQMTGTELAAATRIRWPDMRVLIVSGYSDAIGITPDLPRLEKPFRQADLAVSIAQLMEIEAGA